MLSVRALNWLKSVGYAGMTHEERMTLIAAAKIAYPDDDRIVQSVISSAN